MTIKSANSDKTVAALIHLSTFTMLLFPFGNFIFPLIFWTAKKHDPFVNEHGKQALNFQISFYLYSFFLIMAAVAGAILMGLSMDFGNSFFLNEHQPWIGNPMEAKPVIYYIMIMALLLLSLFILFVYATVSATVKAGEGKLYKYPLSFNFLGASGEFPSSNEPENQDPISSQL